MHIGPHKTGSSALQAFFFHNRGWLRDRDIIYQPVNDMWNNHHPLAVMFKSEDHHQAGRAFLQKMIDENGGKTILLSSEMFCEAGVDRKAIARCLDGTTYRVIGYLRNPCDLLLSAYNEVVRDVRLRRTDALDQPPQPYDPSLMTILRDWIEIGNLSLFPYDPVQWKGGSIFSDFLFSIGVHPDGATLPKTRNNESLPFQLIEALRAANIAGIEGEPRARFIEELRKIDLPRPDYPMSVEHCTSCIDRLKQTLPLYRPFLREGFDESFLLVNPAFGLLPVSRTAG